MPRTVNVLDVLKGKEERNELSRTMLQLTSAGSVHTERERKTVAPGRRWTARRVAVLRRRCSGACSRAPALAFRGILSFLLILFFLLSLSSPTIYTPLVLFSIWIFFKLHKIAKLPGQLLNRMTQIKISIIRQGVTNHPSTINSKFDCIFLYDRNIIKILTLYNIIRICTYVDIC